MFITIGDWVRPNNINLGLPHLPRRSLWRVLDTSGGLKLCPKNTEAYAVESRVAGLLFKPEDFTRQTRNAVGEWVDDEPGSVDDEPAINVANQADPDPDEPRRESKAVAKAREAVKQAADCADRLGDELAKARKAEYQRKAELCVAQLEAQRKEELRKVEAQARADAQRRALQARLHADRCLGEATLELIAEVYRLNNGGAEMAAPTGVAVHAHQLQPLAKSYGYRIVKPSMVALVVKL